MTVKNTVQRKSPAEKPPSSKPAVSPTGGTMESPKRRLLNERLKTLRAETEALAVEAERKLKNLPF